MAIMAMSNRVILVQDFWRLIMPSQITLRQIAKQVDFYIEQLSLPTDTETCLAYHCRKVAVFGAHGIYVLLVRGVKPAYSLRL